MWEPARCALHKPQLKQSAQQLVQQLPRQLHQPMVEAPVQVKVVPVQLLCLLPHQAALENDCSQAKLEDPRLATFRHMHACRFESVQVRACSIDSDGSAFQCSRLLAKIIVA